MDLINKAVIFEYFSGNTTAFQKQQIEAWAQSPENKELFFMWLCEWERLNSQYPADPEKGWYRHQLRMKAGASASQASAAGAGRQISFAWVRKWRAAAVIMLISGLAGWFFKEDILFQTYSTGYGEHRKVLLPDSSKVMLNANSQLKIARFGFGTEIREVYLKGEAGFDVRSDPAQKRFIVRTGSRLDVVVLGTDFNVYARPRGTRVVLNKGRVQLYFRKGNRSEQITMEPGELATLSREGSVILERPEQPSAHSAWKFHRFVFENTSLEEISKQLEDVFGTKFVITSPKLATLTISGSFTALEAEELLDLLCEDSGIAYLKLDGNKILLSEK